MVHVSSCQMALMGRTYGYTRYTLTSCVPSGTCLVLCWQDQGILKIFGGIGFGLDHHFSFVRSMTI